MRNTASLITGDSTVRLIVSFGWHLRKRQSLDYCPSLRGIIRWRMDSPHKGTVTRKAFPCYDVIMNILFLTIFQRCVCRSKVNPKKSKPTDAIQQLMERLDDRRETEKTLTDTLRTLTSKAATPGQSAKAAWGAWMAAMVPHIHDRLFSEFMRNSFSSLMHYMDESKKIREQEWQQQQQHQHQEKQQQLMAPQQQQVLQETMAPQPQQVQPPHMAPPKQQPQHQQMRPPQLTQQQPPLETQPQLLQLQSVSGEMFNNQVTNGVGGTFSSWSMWDTPGPSSPRAQLVSTPVSTPQCTPDTSLGPLFNMSNQMLLMSPSAAAGPGLASPETLVVTLGEFRRRDEEDMSSTYTIRSIFVFSLTLLKMLIFWKTELENNAAL